MLLYLVRHGDAVEPYVDSKRPLSEAGVRNVDALGGQLAGAGVRVGEIWHSEYLRATQTARQLAPYVEAHTVKLYSHLAPGDPVGPVAETVMHLDSDLMLVGHLPFMGLLASQLLSGNPEKINCVFDTATAACIQLDPGDNRLHWLLPATLCRRAE